MRWAQIASRALIVLVVFAASVPAAEWAYRRAGVQVAGAMGGFYEPFGQGSFKPRPNARAFMNWYSGSFTVNTDSTGFRVGDERSDAEAKAPVDVLVLGDSQAFGQGLAFERTIIGEFAALARADGLRVANASVGGHFLRNQVEVASWLVSEVGLKPRAVLLCLTPRATGEPEAYSAAHVEDGELWDRPPGRLMKARAWLSANSAIYLTVRNAIRNTLGDRAADSRGFFFRYSTGQEQEARTRQLAEETGKLRAVLEKAGSRLFVCYLPLAVDAEVDDLAAAANPPVTGVSGRAPLESAEAAARAVGAPFVDASPALAQRRREGKPISLPSDPHYCAETSRLVAETIYAAVDWPGVCGRR